MKQFGIAARQKGMSIISLIFIRFWKTTRDRFFLFFAAAFFIEAVRRVMLGVIPHSSEQEPLFYLIQLVAFLAIVYAIIDKNRTGRPAEK